MVSEDTMYLGLHGTRKVFDSFDINKCKMGAFGPGLYFYQYNKDEPNRSINMAADFAKRRASGLHKNAAIIMASIDANRLLDVYDAKGWKLWQKGVKKWSRFKEEAKRRKFIHEFLTKEGYDGVWNSGRNEIVIYDPAQVSILKRIPIAAN